MSGPVQTIGRLAACTSACVALLIGSAAVAQKTDYGEDPVPQAHETGVHWKAYGMDPTPSTRFDEHATIWAYGFDPVPGITRDPNMRFVPNAAPEFRTSDPAGGAGRRRTCP